MDLISDNSLYRVLAPSLAHGQSPSLYLFLSSTSHCHCSALSLSRECHSSLSLARACADAFYVPFPAPLDRGDRGVLLCALVSLSPCDCGACVLICVRGSLVDTVAVVHSHEKTVKPLGEGEEEMGRGSYFSPSDSRCSRKT